MINRQKQSFVKRAINRQFKIAGHKITYDDCFDIKDWYSTYTMTKKHHAHWKKWFIETLSKFIPKTRAKKEFVWFDFMYGLRIEG